MKKKLALGIGLIALAPICGAVWGAIVPDRSVAILLSFLTGMMLGAPGGSIIGIAILDWRDER